MTKILALIHNGNLSVDEAIVASAKSSFTLLLRAYGAMLRGENPLRRLYIEWENNQMPTESFQTSKSLTDLKKQFEAQGMAVYLHEGISKKPPCSICGQYLSNNTVTVDKKTEEEINRVCYICSGDGKTLKDTDKRPNIKKPLMLAVFAPEDIVRGLV